MSVRNGGGILAHPAAKAAMPSAVLTTATLPVATAVALLAALAAVVLTAAPALAQAQPQSQPQTPPQTQPAGEEPTVVEVRVEGNRVLSDDAVRAYAKTRVGQAYDEILLRADQQRMLQSGYFEGVSATTTRTPGGVIVTFLVVERPKIAKIAFLGNKALKTEQLLKELPFAVGGPLNRFNIEAGRQALLKKYRESGHYFVEVTAREEDLAHQEVAYRIVEGPVVRVRKIVFEGNTHFGRLKLLQSIESQSRLWPFVSGFLDREAVERDGNALRNLYAAEGFLDAEMDARPTFSDDKKNVTLTFRIRQGPRYRVNRLIFEGATVYRDEEFGRRLSLAQGKFFTELALRRDTKAVRDMYGELGFIAAQVDARKVFVDPEAPPPDWAKGLPDGKPALVNILFTIEESDQYTVGRVDIRGNRTTQDHVIRRDVRIFPEQLFNMVAAEESRNRLMETRLFDDVTITPVGGRDKVRDALVTVKEGKTAQFIVGAGVSSNSGLIGNISLTQRNFDLFGWPNENRRFADGTAFKGAGQILTVSAEPGTELMRFYIDWTEPSLFDGPHVLNSRTFIFTRERETYDETRYGEIFSLGRRFPNRWYAELSQRVEGVTIDNLDSDAPPEVRRDEGDHFLLSTRGALVRDRTDSRWMPSTGDRLSFGYEQFYGDHNFGRLEGEYNIYRTVHVDALDRKHILAGKLAAGQIVGDAPVFEEFYGGGLGSIRGFEYRGVSPRSRGTDEPIGGDMLLLAGGEYNFPLVGEYLRGVVFLDTGTVERNTSITTWRASTGFGVRLVIPQMGPVPMSFNFAFPLVKDDQDDTQVFSFSLGWAF